MTKLKDGDVIRFQAQVSQVKTMADGGIRLVLDMSETAIDTATKMMQAKQAGALLEIAAIPVKKPVNGNNRDDDFDFGMSTAFPDLTVKRVK